MDIIVAYMNDYDLHCDSQHGFRKHRSCVAQLLHVVEDLSDMFDNGDPFDIIYLDLKKAFDQVSHERLAVKLESYGITSKLHKWISCFLSNRLQWVKVGTSVTSGIPQGSILGPTLFAIHINELPNCLISQCKMLADDQQIYNKSFNHEIVQMDINNMLKWSSNWCLYFNTDKCSVSHSEEKNTDCDYFMSIGEVDYKINNSQLVTFDPKLNFDHHIYEITHKATKILGILKRTFLFVNKKTFILLYKSFIRPHLEYANVIWYPKYKYQSICRKSAKKCN